MWHYSKTCAKHMVVTRALGVQAHVSPEPVPPDPPSWSLPIWPSRFGPKCWPKLRLSCKWGNELLVRKVSDNFRKYRLIKENEIIFSDMCGCHGNAWRSSSENSIFHNTMLYWSCVPEVTGSRIFPQKMFLPWQRWLHPHQNWLASSLYHNAPSCQIWRWSEIG